MTREGRRSRDASEHAALDFAEHVVQHRGFATDLDVEKARRAGYADGEIVANIALNIFTNDFNRVAVFRRNARPGQEPPMIPVSSMPPPRVLVGTCGFAEARSRTFRDFDLVEVQETFYQPPGTGTVIRWRNAAPRAFVFSLKPWQIITHEAPSPTYRRLKEPLGDADLARAGNFRWNGVTRMAWARTRAIADALGAKAVLFNNLSMARDARRFIERVRRG